MTIKTILVPTDFSEASVVALVYAKQLADALRASIHLLHVTQDPTAQPWAEEAYPASLSEIFGQLKAQARRNFTRALPASDRKKYLSELVVAVGAPFTEIIEYAKKN
jgi:nucleotide-binding universal stress UspA family protein